MGKKTYNKNARIFNIPLVFLLVVCLLISNIFIPGISSKVFAATVMTPKIAGGGGHTLALKSDGTVWAWGHNGYGQLGIGSTANIIQPVQVYNSDASGKLSDIIDIAGGDVHSVALKSDGTIWTWGSNTYGEIGNGSTTSVSLPVQVKGANQIALTGFVAVKAGLSFSVALKNDGTVWTWGNNAYGQLGNSTTVNATRAVQVKDPDGVNYLSGITAIACGISHVLALKNDGTVYAWGLNNKGQLGNKTTLNSSKPVLCSISDVKTIATGGEHSLALKNDGTVWAWGDDTYGQLGSHVQTDSTPEQISSCSNDNTGISAGSGFNLVLKSSNKVYAWGRNDYGQLGIGSTVNTSTPTEVSFGSTPNVSAISTGGRHALAVKKDGSVWVWGYNSYGQLGNGTTTRNSTPIENGFSLALSVPSAPAGFTATAGDAKVSLSWSSSTGAASYNLYRSTSSSGTYTLVRSGIAQTTVEDTTVSNGTTYYYKMTALNALGSESGYTSMVSATPKLTKPSAPTNLEATVGATEVYLIWNASNISYCKVYRADAAGGPFTLMSDCTFLSYRDMNLTTAKTYYYKVVAVNSGGESPASSVLAAKPNPPIPLVPSDLEAAAGEWKVVLTWSNSSLATSYNIKRATSADGPYVTIKTGQKSQTFEDTSVLNGATYYYKVTGVNTAGESEASNVVSLTTAFLTPAPPSNLMAVAGNRKVNLTWGESAGAASYNVYRASDADMRYASVVVTGLTATRYEDTWVSDGLTYYYKVTATGSYGVSPASNVALATPFATAPEAPSNLVASAGDEKVTLTWSAPHTADVYSVWRSTSPGGSATLIAENIYYTSHVDTEVVAGTKYYYTVTAQNEIGTSGYSSQVSAIPYTGAPETPTNLTAIGGDGRVSLSWSPSLGADEYRIWKSTSPDGPYTPVVFNLAATSYEDTDVYNGDPYYYTVQALNEGGESGFSDPVRVVPLP